MKEDGSRVIEEPRPDAVVIAGDMHDISIACILGKKFLSVGGENEVVLLGNHEER